MSPPDSGAGAKSLKDQVLQAIAGFLSECGLDGPAEVLREEIRGSPSKHHAGGSSSSSFSLRLRSLVSILTQFASDPKLCGAVDALSASELARLAAPLRSADFSSSAPLSEREIYALRREEECVDAGLLQIASCEEHLQLDKELSARLHQALASMRSTCVPPEPHEHPPKDEAEASRVPEDRQQEADVEAQPQPPKPTDGPPKPSEHYVPRRLAGPNHPFVDDIPEEYRDDNDPGYRIREVTDAELLMELQEKYALLLSAQATPSAADAPPSPAAAVVTADGAAATSPTAGSQLEEAAATAPGADDDELLQAGGGSALPEVPQLDLAPAEPSSSASAHMAGHPGTDSAGEVAAQEQPSLAATAAAVMTSAGVDNARGAVPTFGAPDSPTVNSEAAVCADDSVHIAPAAGEAAQAAAQAAAQLQMQAAQAQVMQLMQEEQLAAAMASGALPVEAGSQQAAALQAYMAQGQAAAAAQAAAQAAAVQRAAQACQGQVVALPHALANKQKKRRPEQVPYRYADSGDPFYPVELDGTVFDSFNLRVVFERDRTGFEESKEFPIRMNSIVAARYQVLEYLGSAAFSKAVQCLDLQTQRMVCMKIIKNDKDFLDQSLDEIKLLKLINVNVENVDDKHCLRLIDYFYHKEHLIIVTELLRDNLYEFSKYNRDCGDEPFFTLGHLQRITKQVLTALEYIHSLWLIHADLKPENILVKSYSRCEVKVIDFGSSCFVDDHLSSYVQSRSYRAPEVMLGLPYDQKIDIWSLGCIIAELWTGYVLFQNDSIQSMLARIMGIIGSFEPKMLAAGRFVPQYFTQDGRLFREVESCNGSARKRHIHILLPKQSSLRQRMRTNDTLFVDFLSCLLKLDPAERLSAKDALQHAWLTPGRYDDGL